MKNNNNNTTSTTTRVGRPRLPTDGIDSAVLRRRAENRAYQYEKYYDTDPKTQWARAALRDARKRAAHRGCEFALTLEAVQRLAEITDACPILGIELDYSRGRGNGPRLNSATIDRIDNSRGYSPDNAQVISHHANTAKSRLGIDELVQIGDWARRQQSRDIDTARERFGELVAAFCDVVTQYQAERLQ